MNPRPRIQVFALVLLFCLLSCVHYPSSFDEADWRQSVEEEEPAGLYGSHFHEGRYFNPWMDRAQGGLIRFLKKSVSERTRYTQEEKDFKPGFIPGLKERIKATPSGDFIAWIGHSTFLIRLRGIYILTDPIFSERALLPKRVTPPALTAEEVNEIAPEVNVLISHNHYDHLDAPSIKALSDASKVIVPMGLKPYVEEMDKSHVEEMDWWQRADLGHGVTIVCLPAQHWSRRLTQGTNRTLWASYMILTPEVTIYFAGDSGYFAGYKEYGKVFPRITYAIIPTTALNPRTFMYYAHMNVDEALDAFRELNAKYFIPTHWGTFQISAEPPGYPVLELRRKIEKLNLDPSRYLIMDLGQLLPIEEAETQEDQWQAAGAGGVPAGPDCKDITCSQACQLRPPILLPWICTRLRQLSKDFPGGTLGTSFTFSLLTMYRILDYTRFRSIILALTGQRRQAHYERRPERFKGRMPKPMLLPDAVWINKPSSKCEEEIVKYP